MLCIARQGLNDGLTTTAMRCPLCRETDTLQTWRRIFDLPANEEVPPPPTPPVRVYVRRDRRDVPRLTRRNATRGAVVLPDPLVSLYQRPTE